MVVLEGKNGESLELKDSGNRTVWETGSNRDMQVGKGRMDLLPFASILRLSRWYEMGAEKYGSHNWEKGIPVYSFLSSAIRHVFKWAAGMDDEDHLAAAVWNLLAIMFYQNYDNYASLFDDVPTWNGRKTKWVYDIGVENYDTTKIKSNTTSKKTSN